MTLNNLQSGNFKECKIDSEPGEMVMKVYSTPSLQLFPGPLWPGVVVCVKASIMD